MKSRSYVDAVDDVFAGLDFGPVGPVGDAFFLGGAAAVVGDEADAGITWVGVVGGWGDDAVACRGRPEPGSKVTM